MLGPGKIKNRNPLDPKSAVVNLGSPAHIHHHTFGVECPLRIGQLAGGYRAVMDDETVSVDLLHHFTGECEWTRRREDHVPALEAQASGASYVIKFAGFAIGVVLGAASLDVRVVRAAVETHVAGGGGVAGGGIVGDFVGAQNVAAKIDFNIAPQLVNIALFFLLTGFDGHGFADARLRERPSGARLLHAGPSAERGP